MDAEVLRILNDLQREVSVLAAQVGQLASQQVTLATLLDRVTRVEGRVEAASKQGETNRSLTATVLVVVVGLLAIAAAHVSWH